MRKAFIDWHAHLYDCYRPNVWLDSASTNLLSRENYDPIGVLCVYATCLNRDYDLNDLMSKTFVKDWTATAMDVPYHWHLQSMQQNQFVLIGGQQIVTAEGIEVLVLGCAAQAFASACPLVETIESALFQSYLVTLPWGVGKWLGRRGHVIRQAIDIFGPQIAAGDNANRPRVWKKPSLLTYAHQSGLHVLPGSDPLPLLSHVTRVGSYGSMIDAPSNLRHLTVAWLLDYLKNETDYGIPIGRRVSTPQSILDQMCLRVNSRRLTQ